MKRYAVAMLALALLVAGPAVFAQKATISMIHFMSPALSDAGEKAFAASMEAYRAAHPDVEVQDEFIDHDNYEAKLKTMVASKELPDIYYSKPDLFPLLRKNGLVAPIDEILKADKAFAGLFKPGAFSDFLVDGKTWGFPFQLQSNHVVYYNKAIFKKAGIDGFPNTMDAFVEACKKIKAAGFIPIALGNKDKWVAPSCFFNTVAYRYTDASWFAKIQAKKASFQDKPFVDAAALMVTLVKAGAFNEDFNAINNDQQRALFFDGQAAMFIEGSWALGPVIDNAIPEVKENAGIAILPPVAGKEKLANLVAGGAGWAVCINPAALKDKAKKAAITTFVKELYGQKYADVAAENGGFPAVFPKIDESKLDPLQKEYFAMKLSFGPIFDVQLPAPIVDAFYFNLQELLMGKITPEEYAKRVQAANK